MTDETLLSARGLALSFGAIPALVDVEVDLWAGELLAIVGESGSGKTTLLNVLSGRVRPDDGVVLYRDPAGATHDVHAMPAPALRTLHRSDWGFVHQDPRQNLRMNVSAGGNVGERLMARCNTQPFILDAGDGGHTEFPGDEYVLGYWLGRFVGAINAP